MTINTYNLSSGCNETIEHDKKREAIKNVTASQTIIIGGYNEKNINKRDTYLSKIKIFLSNNHNALN
jgi:hypothetical protein